MNDGSQFMRETELKTEALKTEKVTAGDVKVDTFPLFKLFEKTRIRAGFIEGDKWQKLLKQSAVVFNDADVLDSPLSENKMTYSECSKLKKEKGWILSESSFLTFNEKKVQLRRILILNYLIEHGHSYSTKPSDEPIDIIFHVHRNERSANPIYDNVKHLIAECSTVAFTETSEEKEACVLKSSKANIYFRCGYSEAINDPVYTKADILYSHSLVVGLDPTLPTGSVLLPDEMSPLNIETFELREKKSPTKENYLIRESAKIVSQPQEKLIVVYRLLS